MGSKLNYFHTRPKVVPIDTRLYLQRLNLTRALPDLKFLKKLHRAHLLHIPFENLDIHYGGKISLEIPKIFEKVVQRRRGGLCFELNALFFHLLSNLGFEAYLGSARVYQNDQLTPEFDHMLVFVVLPEGQFLCDIGFGSLFNEPKALKKNAPVLDYTRYYTFESDPDERWILKKSKDGSDYKRMYNFEIKSRELIEFMPRCLFHQGSMDSRFRKEKLITQLTTQGRTTLNDYKLTITALGETKEHKIMNQDEFFSALEQHFQIDAMALLRQQLE